MTIKKILVLILTLSLFSAKGQDSSTLDSLKRVLNSSTNDSVTVKTLLTIGDKYYRTFPDSSLIYYFQLIKIVDSKYNEPNKTKESSLANSRKAAALLHIGAIYYYKGEYNQALDFYQKAINTYQIIGDYKGISDTEINIGSVYLLLGDFNKAIEYYTKPIEFYESANNKKGISDCYLSIGLVHYYQKNFTKAIENLTKSEKIYKEIDHKIGLANCYNNLGISVYELGQYDKSIEYYQKSLEIEKELGRKNGISLSYNNIGNIYRIQGKYQKAMEMYLESLKIKEETGDKNGITTTYCNIATFYAVLADSSSINSNQTTEYLNKAIYYGLKAFYLAKELGATPLVNSAALDLKTNYNRLGQYKQALEFADEYITTKDSMYNEEKSRVREELMVKYETERKEKEIQQQQLELQKTKLRFTMVLSTLGLFILVSVFLVYIIRLKHKTEKLLEAKNKELQISNATKDKFFSIISHDLRTPVSGFRNLSTSIGRNFDSFSPNQVKEHLIDLGKSADETISMLNNLLQWAKSQQNKIDVKKFPAKLSRIINSIANEVETERVEKNIQIDVFVDESLEAEVDNNIIATVLRNLLTNAIKFSPANSTVTIKATQSNSHVQVSVSDQGIGISEKDIEKLFRIDCDTKNIGNSTEKGSGIGLILCSELINLHGGNILVESEIDKGSTFSFTI